MAPESLRKVSSSVPSNSSVSLSVLNRLYDPTVRYSLSPSFYELVLGMRTCVDTCVVPPNSLWGPDPPLCRTEYLLPLKSVDFDDVVLVRRNTLLEPSLTSWTVL